MTNHFLRRGALFVGLILLSLVTLAPTFFPQQLPAWWTASFAPIHLGLDLQGGIHLVLGVDVDKALAARTDSLAEDVETLLQGQNIVIRRLAVTPPDLMKIELYDQDAAAQTETLLKENHLPFDAVDETVQGSIITKSFRVSAKEADDVKEYAMRQALETLRNRVDQFGVSEPVLQRQGGNRILIQLPGIKDPQRAIALIGRTAQLEFKLEAEGIDPQTEQAGLLPSGTERLWEKRTDPYSDRTTEYPIVVEAKTVLTGDMLADAKVRLDRQFGRPYVGIEFNPVGAKRFDEITAANVGRRLAIILDDTVYSAPVIRERITGGSAEISGTFTEQEAADLAIALRSGSLPAPVHILENRTVGPSLGLDSIHKGVLSFVIGTILVVMTMVVIYRKAGFIADLALILNVLFILAALSLFQATLTLPGIAGIVLTIGMAVDANVLINERIREELALGRTPWAAVGTGYGKAYSSIVDSNLTTLIAALVLFQFGTGPVKGFAVTLSIGIASSMFTAILVTRFIFDYLIERRKIDRLSI